MRRTIFFIAAVVVAGGSAFAARQSSVTQYGITWTFDKSYDVGTYANGDYWVAGPVVITSITPNFTGSANGWEVNPSSNVSQGFDANIPNFNAGLVPTLPYTARPGESVVKTIRHSDPPPHVVLKTAAVLTVVNGIPAGNGAVLFRPGYFGTNKKSYSTDDIDLSPLRNLPPVAAAKTMDWVTDRYRRVQLDHKQGAEPGRMLHPSANMPDYGSDITRNSAEAVLALCLNYPESDKRAAAVHYIQAGIDLYTMWQGGRHWSASGGHMNGRKLPIAMAGILLNDDAILDAVKAAGKDPLPIYGHQFSEDGQFYYSAKADGGKGKVLYGDLKWAEGSTGISMGTWQTKYWQSIYADKGNRLVRDPYGYIDGGVLPGGSYQYCCISMPDMATALATELVDGLAGVWDNPTLIAYADRWKEHGAWTQPDPCAPPPAYADGNWDTRDAAGYGDTWGPDPDKPGDCIRDTDNSDGIGRFPHRHGVNAFDGEYTSVFTKLMFAYYRDSASSTAAVVTGRPAPAAAVSEISILPNPVRSAAVITAAGPVEILDMAGNVVYRVASAGTGRRMSLRWDGTGTDGQYVADGTYFVRSGNDVARIMVIR